MTTKLAIADTNALMRLLVPAQDGHEEHKEALARMHHMIVSPFVLAELDYLITARGSAKQAITANRFIERLRNLNRIKIPDVAPHFAAATTVAEAYTDVRGGKGIGLTDAMNVVLAKVYRTDAMFTSDKNYRIIQPLTGHDAFRLLPEDL
ncbi:PIN domain-containing protein [Streptomyces sp. NPDC058471]|uniref:PIN domain-containing protein n=1 Tax=Streptomyces sp. NPDC058471 TaxID=3346516 RepID=UPI003669617F